MSATFITRPPRIMGAYMVDHAQIAPSLKSQNFWISESDRYLPLLNLVTFNERAELKLANPEVTGEDIETYNSKNLAYTKPHKNLVQNYRIDVNEGDLLVGGIRMVLNFMEVPVVVKTRSDIPKLFKPLSNAQLEEYKGKVVVLSFHSFNTPGMIREEMGYFNYMEALFAECVKRGEGNTTPAKMLAYMASKWKEYEKNSPKGIPVSNSIKIAMVHEYTVSDFIVGGKEIADLYCAESGLSFRRSMNVLDLPVHPKHSDTLMANRQIVQSMRDNGVSCFIVDNQRKLSDRFINFVGQVRKIQSIVDNNRPEGLYITSVDGEKGLNADEFVVLDKVDECPYIYRSHEEALSGSDVRQQAQQTHELAKLEMGVTTSQLNLQATELKHAYDEQIRMMELEAKRKQAEMDSLLRSKDLAHQEAVRDLKLQEEKVKGQLHRDKFRFDVLGMENKYLYESQKYDRDTTVETLKTIGSVVGLLAGGYVIYKQLSK